MGIQEFRNKRFALAEKTNLEKDWKHVTLQAYPQSFLVKYCCSKSESYQVIEKKFGLVCQYEETEQVQP